MPDRSPGPVVGIDPNASPGGAAGGDWPTQAADAIVNLVGQVRDATTTKAITASRGVVYGLLAGILGGFIAVLAAVAGVRMLDAYLPSSVFGDSHVWAAHLLIGLVFTLSGSFLWTRRHAPTDR